MRQLSEDGKSYEVSISLAHALNTIGALGAIKKIGKKSILDGEGYDGKAAKLIECMQVAIDVMYIFIQEKYQGSMELLEEELKKIKDAQNDSEGTEIDA